MMGPRGILEQEARKPIKVGATLARLGKYFGSYAFVLFLVAGLIVATTWAQVAAPELIGQATDCFISPAIAQTAADTQAAGAVGIPGMEDFAKQMGGSDSASKANCWYADLGENPASADLLAGLGRLVLLIVALYVGVALLNGIMFYLMSWAGNHVLRNLREEVFAHIHKLSLGYFSKNEAGDVMSRITNDMDTLQQAISFALLQVLSGVLLLVWILYKMLTLNVTYALISMAVVPFMIVATLWFSSQARKAFRAARQEIGNVNANLQESISGVREVQAFAREDANIESFRSSNAANRDANIRAVAFTAALSPTLEALGYVAIAIAVGVGGVLLLRGQSLGGSVVSLGLIVTFLGYVQRFNQPIQQVSVLWTNIQSAVAGAERIFGLMDEVPDIMEAPKPLTMPKIEGRVTFENVTLAYNLDEMVLKGVSLDALPGQTVAIVGPTGAGKTTIINLIPRFYDALDGVVKIDGIDVRDVTLSSLRKQVGIVLQDSFLFSDTVMNNIRYGNPEATDAEVMEAAQLARADTFIQGLSEGYQTILGERGGGLSQGQRQLISIARAALTDPRILILDEATSSVDTRTEQQIQAALDHLLTGRTSFVIAHRLSTIRNADQVLVLEAGLIVERGTHDELLTKRGAYYDLYMSQFRREEDEPVAVSG
ncbi:MAG: ABC transporter ATP-binding protein [Caldilineaceae bacterium]|nr:ABC transporter ATP-binding protein [Caldilineaceae bacterium]MBP8107687.1 ABC transporter ATP-binding protein [Caldilineaceae bacterium]MBP8122891.1 ABC transporter ATP-binding protein [Caldilineaceae bacterium]MBP9072278.1 ABC transporter ATP-binding protein [Caldilineaceae bacterium]